VIVSEHLIVGAREFEKFQVIEHVDTYAGLCHMLTRVLNEAQLALRNNRLPVVNLDDRNDNYYYDPDRGPNVWDYYFEPIMGVSFEELSELVERGKVPSDLIHREDPEQILRRPVDTPERLQTFWDRHRPEDPVAWFERKRKLGSRAVSQLLRIRPHIRSAADDFFERHLQRTFAFGVHIRGTDLAYAEATPPERYFQEIAGLASTKGLSDFKVFLATDQEQFVDAFQREYGERVVTFSESHSNNEVPTFLRSEFGPYKLGQEVIIDILLLSRCQHLLKGASAPGEYAMWFSPALPCTNFAVESRRRRAYAGSAFYRLNIAGARGLASRAGLLLNAARWQTLEVIMAVARRVLPKRTRDLLWRAFGRRLLLPGATLDRDQ
jgi:hypothetical protein